MQTLSNEEFKKRYGTTGLSMLKKSNETQNVGYGQRLKQAASSGIGKFHAGKTDFDSLNPLRMVEGAVKGAAGLVETAFSPITAAIEPVTKPTLGRAVQFTSDKISDSPQVQNFAISKIGEITARITEDINNLNTIAGAVAGPKGVSSAGSKATGSIRNAVDNIPPLLPRGSGGAIKSVAGNVVKDIAPTSKGIINDQITRAFELTPGDVFKISKKTGNEVGDFISNNNLIGKSVDESKNLLTNFKNQNYKQVRSEIGQVKTQYSPAQVPRYTEALKELQKQVTDVPGLQTVSAEVNALLKKSKLELTDIQRVKELMDEHFDLYNVIGDVKSNIAKQGLDNVRGDLRAFVETEVKNNSGVDIRALNNNVSTSQTVLNAMRQRAGRGSTRSSVSLADLGWFGGGSVVGTPLFGAALVFGKKVLESPTVRLRIAKFIKDLDDAKKARIKTDLQSGKIPEVLKKRFVKVKVKDRNKPAKVKVNGK